MKAAAMIKSTSAGVEVFAIDEHPAVRHVAVVIELDIVVMPIRSPMVPTPTEAAKEADSEAEAPSQPWSGKVQSWIPIPAWPHGKRLSIHEPRIVLRNVNHFRVGGLNHNRLSLIADFFLRC